MNNSKVKTQYARWLAKLQEGFSLLELVVVIGIIGVLTGLLTTNYIASRQRARDTQRKADIRQIQAALELHRADRGIYPLVSEAPYQLNPTPVNCPTPTPFSSGTSTYMQKIPCDPLANGTWWNGGNYYYYSTGAGYKILTCLENTTDPQLTGAPTPGASGTCPNNAYMQILSP